jgi:D-xylose transport system substrate-binding protein
MADIDGASSVDLAFRHDDDAMFLAPVPITKDNLDRRRRRLDHQEDLCQGVEGGPAPCN